MFRFFLARSTALPAAADRAAHASPSRRSASAGPALRTQPAAHASSNRGTAQTGQFGSNRADPLPERGSLIPLGDDHRPLRTPVMTYLIIWRSTFGGVGDRTRVPGSTRLGLAATVCNLGMVPGELTHLAPLGQSVPIGPGLACAVDNDPINILTPLISMFLHGGWVHLLGNMRVLRSSSAATSRTPWGGAGSWPSISSAVWWRPRLTSRSIRPRRCRRWVHRAPSRACSGAYLVLYPTSHRSHVRVSVRGPDPGVAGAPVLVRPAGTRPACRSSMRSTPTSPAEWPCGRTWAVSWRAWYW